MNLVGVTLYGSNAELSTLFAFELRRASIKAGIDTMIIGGGPYLIRERGLLKRDRKPFPDSIDWGLSLVRGKDLAFDGLVHGGFQAFIDVYRQARKGQLTMIGANYLPKYAIDGYYCRNREKRKIYGGGIARVPKHKAAPFTSVSMKGETRIYTSFSNFCPNNCGFCSYKVCSYRFSPEQVREGARIFRGMLREKKHNLRNGKVVLNLEEPNPLCSENMPHTLKCLEVIAQELEVQPQLACFLEPYLLLEPEKMLEYIRQLNITALFVGRDGIEDPGRKFMMRNHKGELKTQAQINREKEGLFYVLNALGQGKEKFYFSVSYILDPLSDKQKVLDSFDEMIEVEDKSTKGLDVEIHWRLLWPYPGTEVLRKHTDLVSEKPYFVRGVEQTWDRTRIRQRYPESFFTKHPNMVLHDSQARSLKEVRRRIRGSD
jgi:hypothetical protein